MIFYFQFSINFVFIFLYLDPTTKLFNLFTTNSKINPSNTNDTKRTLNEHNNQTNSSFIDNNNPFLHAPFHYTHRSPTHKQVSSQTLFSSTNNDSITTSNISSFDPTSIVVGKRLSAFAPYHRHESNSGNNGKLIFRIDYFIYDQTLELVESESLGLYSKIEFVDISIILKQY